MGNKKEKESKREIKKGKRKQRKLKEKDLQEDPTNNKVTRHQRRDQ